MEWTPAFTESQRKICESRIIPADKKLNTVESLSWDYIMSAKTHYASALTEIERLQSQYSEYKQSADSLLSTYGTQNVKLQKEITTLKELVMELVESLSELSNEYCDTEQNHNQYCGKGIVGKYQHKENVCTCGYEEVYVKSRALIQKAQEVVK